MVAHGYAPVSYTHLDVYKRQCPDCLGLGYKMEFDIDLMIPDRSLSILDGAIVVTGWQSCTNEGSFSRAILDLSLIHILDETVKYLSFTISEGLNMAFEEIGG